MTSELLLTSWDEKRSPSHLGPHRGGFDDDAYRPTQRGGGGGHGYIELPDHMVFVVVLLYLGVMCWLAHDHDDQVDRADQSSSKVIYAGGGDG